MFNNRIDPRRAGQFHEWLKKSREFQLPLEFKLEE